MVNAKTTWRVPLRRLGLVAAGAFAFGLFAGRLGQRATARRAITPPEHEPARAFQPLDDSRAPRHDRPSGYFSARGEGTMTNTPQTNPDVLETPRSHEPHA
jgi:hypothetical protein